MDSKKIKDIELQIINILPCRMGKDFVDLAKSLNLDPVEATKTLGELIENKYVDATKDEFILTDKAKEFLKKDNIEIKEDISNIHLKKSTKELLSKVIIDSKRIKIHPAMDFTNEKAYTIAFLTFEDDIVNGKTVEKKEVERPVIITSEREFFRTDNLPKDIVLTEPPIETENVMKESILSKLPSQSIVMKYLEGKGYVTFQEVFKDVKDKFEYYMDFEDKRDYSLCALWSIGTYYHQMFSAFPYLYINAVFEAGKSKLLTTIGYMSFCFEPFVAPSSASFYRIIQAEKCTLLIDESEDLNKRNINMDMRTILLQGYKTGSGVPRVEERTINKEKRRFTTVYNIYSPKVLANIMGIETILESRCIPIVLERTLNTIIKNRKPENPADKVTFQPIRDKLFLNQMLNWKKVRENYDFLGDLMTGKTESEEFGKEVEKIRVNIYSRNWELWQPILALGLCVSKEIFNEMIDLAIDTTKEKEQDQAGDNFDTMIVKVLCLLVKENDVYGLSDLVREMKNYEGLEYLKVKSLSIVLKRLGLRRRNFDGVLEKPRTSTKRCVRLYVEDIKKCAKKLGIDYDDIRVEENLEEAIPKKERLLNAIRELNEKRPDGFHQWEILLSAKTIYPEAKLLEMIEKYKTEGVLYSPKVNIYSMVKGQTQTTLKESKNVEESPDDEPDGMEEEGIDETEPVEE